MPLNPNAPAFSFNAGAAEFVPGGSSFSAPSTEAPVPVSNTNGALKLKSDAPAFVPGASFTPSDSSSKSAPATEAKANAQAEAQKATAGANASGPGKSWASLASKKPEEEASSSAPKDEQGAGQQEGGAKQGQNGTAVAGKAGVESSSSSAPAAAPAAAPAESQGGGGAEKSSLEAKRPAELLVAEKTSEPLAAAQVSVLARALKDAPVHPLAGATYDMKALLGMKKDATPVEVLHATMEGFQKCLEDAPELDPVKEMPSRQQGDPGSAGGPRGVRRQDSGTPRTPKSGKGKNDAPLRDRTGKIIEVKALEVSENRWKPAKATDEEEKVFKAIKGILNKLTLEKFDKLYAELLATGITSASLMKGFVVILYDKAVLEPTFIGMYARMCERLATDLPEMTDSEGVIPFADVLIGKCRAEFESIGQEAESAQLEGLVGDDRDQKLRKMKQRTLGNVEFIGELFKKNMVGAEEVDMSINKMLESAKSDHDAIQPLCKLMEGVGKVLEAKDKAQMDGYFAKMDELAGDEKLSARFRFMLLDLKDMRSNGWVPRRAAAGPQMLGDVQKEVDKENRYTEKKKEPENKNKKQGGRDDKKKGGGGNRKAEAKVEDDGWSQVTTAVKGKQQNSKGKKQEVAAPTTPQKGGQKGGGNAKPGGKVAMPSRGGFAALMGNDSDEDDSDEEESDEDEDEEKEGASEEAEESEEESEEEDKPRPSKQELLSPEGENAVGSILEEYLCIYDADEVVQCLHELYGKGYGSKDLVNEEVVRKGLMIALEAGEKESQLMGKMFSHLLEKQVLLPVDSAKGFCDVLADLPDITIDIPKAPQLMASIIQTLLEKGLLDTKTTNAGVSALCEQSASMEGTFQAVRSLLAQ
mmetsp:Transcript_46477/g.95046  ORF Transcript_46477/g.95046 Transcript_46477/m.95046 type:complete len:869 (+) Transcript_46477:478-3084(+)